MRKPFHGWASAAVAATWILVSLGAHAQSSGVTPEDEFKKRVHVSEDIQPLGENPFGESISLYNGALGFNETDISAAGTGPLIQISRSFKIPDVNPSVAFHDFHSNEFNDWSLDVPHIETLSAPTKKTTNGVVTYQWFLLDDFYATGRCDSIEAGPDMFVSVPGSVVTYPSESWWHGYQLVVPGAGGQTMLRRSAANTAAPQMTDVNGAAIAFPTVTKDNWAIGCLPQTSNGQFGEGFLAVSPDGTKYWLDRLTYKSADFVLSQPGGALKRRTIRMMVSKVMDRFGNTVNYNYDADDNLTSIVASDGREVDLNYVQWQVPTADPGPSNSPPTTYTSFRISSITLQPASGAPRTWTYSYTADPNLPRLSSVQLPDGSSWSFNLGGIPATNANSVITYDESHGTCTYSTFPSAEASGSGTITHPSGLVGTFSTKVIIRGRSNVGEPCQNTNLIGRYPRVYAQTAIQQKSFTGAGLGTQTWTYAYSPSNESWAFECTAGCVTTVYTDVTDPSGNGTRYTFSNEFDASESLLQRTDAYAGAVGGPLVRSDVNTYANPVGGPWPSTIGTSPELVVNAMQLGELSPVSQRTLQQDGDTYVSLTEPSIRSRIRRKSCATTALPDKPPSRNKPATSTTCRTGYSVCRWK